jgi:hypothetical protein
LEGYSKISEVQGFSIYEDTEARPRFFLMPEKAKSADGSTTDGGAFFLVLDHRLYRNLVAVDTPEGRTFVLNEFFSRNWRARLDGAAIPTTRVGESQIGVSVPPGNHLLEMVYSPRVFQASVLLGACGCCALLCVMLCAMLARKRHALEMRRADAQR